MTKMGLYLHFPFCPTKCHFCSFGSRLYHSPTSVRYLTALKNEINHHGKLRTFQDKEISTIYFGGGTPTLAPKGCADLLIEIQKNFKLGPYLEITLEAHPGSVSFQDLLFLKKAGFNRLSFGVQSFFDSDLSTLNRGHLSQDIDESFAHARNAGFENINLDLIYGLPGQTLTQWEKNLVSAMKLYPEHLSIYGLTLEEGTYFYHLFQQGQLKEIDEETQAKMYHLARAMLKKKGYIQYEISNFAKPGFECKHNLHYWTQGNFLGLGAFACSYLDGVHSSNVSSIEGYIRKTEEAGWATEMSEILDPETRLKEAIIFGLRKCSGIHLSEFNPDFKHLLKSYLPKLIRLSEEGLLHNHCQEHFYLTEDGFLFSDFISISLS